MVLINPKVALLLAVCTLCHASTHARTPSLHVLSALQLQTLSLQSLHLQCNNHSHSARRDTLQNAVSGAALWRQCFLEGRVPGRNPRRVDVARCADACSMPRGVRARCAIGSQAPRLAILLCWRSLMLPRQQQTKST